MLVQKNHKANQPFLIGLLLGTGFSLQKRGNPCARHEGRPLLPSCSIGSPSGISKLAKYCFLARLVQLVQQVFPGQANTSEKSVSLFSQQHGGNKLPVLWVLGGTPSNSFGPKSIGKHITQLVANWVFPRESVLGPESIGKNITQLVANWVFPREPVLGPESIGKHITQLVANWVFPRESVFGPESIGKHITQLVANWVFPSETEYIAAFLACHYGDWWLAMLEL